MSTVPLHTREARPVAAESAPSENRGAFSSPAFDPSGALLAVYDSGVDRVRIFRSSDLADVDSLKPARWPRRLSFSPGGQFLVIEAHPGWIEDHLKNKALPDAPDIGSAEAVRDDIQRVEIWNLRTGQTIPDLRCDAVATRAPEGGWLWAKNKAITPGYRSSAVLEAHFSADEQAFSVLCWNGVQQRWDSRSWQRLEDSPPPPFWDALIATAQWLPGYDPASLSTDGRIALLRVRGNGPSFATTYLWDRHSSQARHLPGECATRLQPVYAVSSDGSRIVVACSKGLGYAVRAWNLGTGREVPLSDADFGFARGAPLIRGEGLALSPNGRYLAVALLELKTALVATPILAALELSRSDLRLWSLEDGRERTAVPIDDLAVRVDHFRGVDLAFSPDGGSLVLAGAGMRIYRLTDLESRPRR